LKRTRQLLAMLCILYAGISFAQTGNNLRERIFMPSTDTIQLDTLSIINGSEIVFMADGSIADSSHYEIDYFNSILILKQPVVDSLRVVYRAFPINFSMEMRNKDIRLIEPDARGMANPFAYVYDMNTQGADIFKMEGLNKNGSISRGVTFGNNQDLAVNSNMSLQLSGKVNERVSILAAITDHNIPIQPDGNTYQLQDFDQVYIQLFDEHSKLTAGDFQLSRPNSYFMNYFKRAQGGHFSTATNIGKDKAVNKTSASAAVSRGKFSRNMIQGMEGVQGPYRLRGAENETFIIVLSGTENVYIDGKLLKRGQEYDYVIDYNTAEVTFTANTLITKDKRIVVEFQYSDRNYARSVFTFGNEIESSRLRANFNFYTEQDAKNQSLLQDLSPEQKALMASIGDSLNHAISPNVDSVGFSSNQVLYRLSDTIAGGVKYDSIYVYSTDPANAYYRVGFSQVGENRGNYRQVSSTANGKVFQWVAPVNGIPQGTHEPITLLITPKKRQMATFGGEYKISNTTRATFELAASNNDINTFSSLHNENNTDIAFKVGVINESPLNTSAQSGWVLTSKANYEQVNRNFKEIERFRTVEFERDWNILQKDFSQGQHITTLGAGLSRAGVGAFAYEFSSFNSQSEYNASLNSISAKYTKSKYDFDFAGSNLKSDGFEMQTNFLRHRGSLARRMKYFTVGLWEDFERNMMHKQGDENLLSASSYQYFEWEAFVSNPDTAVNKYSLRYRQRYDDLPFENQLARATFGESVTFDFGLNKNPNSVLRGSSTYRRLTITNENLINAQPEETVLGRLEYSLRVLKGAVTSNTFYEVGSGLEVKKEFTFIEVPAGQGVYAYIGDLNNNGVKDLDEFEIAPMPDLARYIKVFTPTSEFVRVYSNQFNQALNINPAAVWSVNSGFKKFASRFANQTAYRIDRRTGMNDAIASFNPFYKEVQDTMLLSLNSSVRNTIFFNRNSSKYGFDYSWQDNRNKNILVNGFESRTHIFRNLRSRWNITRVWMVNFDITQGKKTNESEFLKNRNFLINYQEVEPRLVYQPNTNFRASLLYKFAEKKNLPSMGGEEAISNNFGTEIKYAILDKGNLLFNLNYIINEFNAAENTLLAFEMLEGLQIGKNITWSVSYQKNLSQNMQVNINYTGRGSETAPTVHTGGIQVRAFF
jgi:hypothetical protein